VTDQVRLLLSGGRGPRECAWAVAEPVHRLETDTHAHAVTTRRIDAPPNQPFTDDDVDIIACRTGGPGGQHRNKASTAVRATHRPTGQVVVDTERQFSANRRIALLRLRHRIEQAHIATQRDTTTDLWTTHDQLIRGNPTRVERPKRGHQPP
jgi:peptide chain release factor